MALLLTKTRAAEELGVSRDVLLRLLNRGEIPVTMVDQEERIAYAELVRFVERKTEHHSSPTLRRRYAHARQDVIREAIETASRHTRGTRGGKT